MILLSKIEHNLGVRKILDYKNRKPGVKILDFDIAVIDFTSSLLNVCIGSINKAGQVQSKVNVGVECNGIRKGVIYDMDTVVNALSETIKNIKNDYGIGIKSAFVNVPCYMCQVDQHFVTENVFNKEVDKDVLHNIKNKLLSVPKKDNSVVIDIALTKFILDNNMEVRDPLGKFANQLSASSNIVSLNSEYFTVLNNLFDRVGLQMDGIVMNTLSGLSLLPFSDSERSNVIMINISWEITDITVCSFGKIVYIDTIFAGAKNIVKDVSIGLNISVEDAERFLHHYPVADPLYIKSDLENTVRGINGENITFKLSDMVTFTRDRILDIYEICADIEKYTGYLDQVQQVFGLKYKKIPYALFEVEDICYGTGCGMIRYISHHPLLKRESLLNVKKETKHQKKESILKKVMGLLKID